MAKKGKSGKKGGKKKAAASASSSSPASASAPPPPSVRPSPPPLTRVVADAAPGCHMAVLAGAGRPPTDASTSTAAAAASGDAWLLGEPEPFDRADFGLPADAHVPDISVEPEEHVLTVINSSASKSRSYHITVEHAAFGREGMPLEAGVARDEDGAERPCTALILLVPPLTMVDVCELDLDGLDDVAGVKLSSDIVDYHPHPDPHRCEAPRPAVASPPPTTPSTLPLRPLHPPNPPNPPNPPAASTSGMCSRASRWRARAPSCAPRAQAAGSPTSRTPRPSTPSTFGAPWARPWWRSARGGWWRCGSGAA